MDSETLHGVIQGDAIHLDQPSRLPSGTSVEVVLTPTRSPLAPAQELTALFGAWSEDGDALDEFVEWCRQQRKEPMKPT